MLEDYFEVKARKLSDQTVAVNEAYTEKRQRLASLWMLDPKTAQYRSEIKALCACKAPWVNAGCIVHGLGITVYEKARAWNVKKDL